jgi:protein-S-isoprenylcysteine O-methyltransferase Ste14
VTPLGWLAALVLFLQLPIPLFWFIVHLQVNFWRRHQKAGYITGVLLSWGPVTFCLVFFRHNIFIHSWPSSWKIAVGLGLLLFEGWIFWKVERDLGTSRLIGRTELSGGGEVANNGIYARIRHPRYMGSMIAILGACLLAGTRVMWVLAAVWCMLTLVAIMFEERELRARFGAVYEEYCRRVPRFVPLRPKPREG